MTALYNEMRNREIARVHIRLSRVPSSSVNLNMVIRLLLKHLFNCRSQKLLSTFVAIAFVSLHKDLVLN